MSPHIIARGGFAAPGGGLFVGFGSFVITDSGLAAFQAALRPDAPGPDLLGIYRIIIGSPVSLDKVAVEGEVAPLAGGAVFNASGGLNGNFIPRMNNANGVAFRSTLSGAGVTAANANGIWGHDDVGSLSLLAREGSPLPAAGAGVTIGVINPTPPALNGANRIAFRATLAGDGITFANDDAIIAANALGDLVIAAREGQVVEIAPGEFRTFTSFGNITGPGTQDGSSTSWNDDGRLLFRAEFFGGGGGIGMFIADMLRLNLGQVTVTSVSGDKVNLSWFGAPNVHLQSATNLTAAIAWADVPDTAGQSSAAVPWAGPQMFFRLASP